MQDHAEKLQRKLVKQIHEGTYGSSSLTHSKSLSVKTHIHAVKSSESALASHMCITRESMGCPSMALDKEKRKVSTAHHIDHPSPSPTSP